MKWFAMCLASLLLGVGIGFFAGRFRAAHETVIGPATGSSASNSSMVEIQLTAKVDGSDRFVFSGESLWNEHLQWQHPTKVTFNGEPWDDLTIAPPSWPELARELDLPKAAIVSRKGRDVISLETTQDGFALYFADSPMGSGTYEVTIAIPRKK